MNSYSRGDDMSSASHPHPHPARSGRGASSGAGVGAGDHGRRYPAWPSHAARRARHWPYPVADPGVRQFTSPRPPDAWRLHPDASSSSPDRNPDADTDADARHDPRRIAMALRHPHDARSFVSEPASSANMRPPRSLLGEPREPQHPPRSYLTMPGDRGAQYRTSPCLAPSAGPSAGTGPGGYDDAAPGLPRLSMLLQPHSRRPPYSSRPAAPDDEDTRGYRAPHGWPSPVSVGESGSPTSTTDSPRSLPPSRWNPRGMDMPSSSLCRTAPRYVRGLPLSREAEVVALPDDPSSTLLAFQASGGSGARMDPNQSPSQLSGDEDDANGKAEAGSAAGSSPGSGSEPKPPNNKNSRYLREMDRRAILSRLANGEKQSTLAKEYQVSRAAICNLNKHRDEVLSRADQNPLAKHPKKRKLRASSSVVMPKPKLLASPASENTNVAMTNPSPSTFSSVVEVKSRAVQLLLTTLRNRSTTLSEFHRSGERVMRLLVEEALAAVPTKPVEVDVNDRIKTYGIGIDHPPCGISMEQQYAPMLEMFRMIEPTQPSGFVRFQNGSNQDATLDETENARHDDLKMTLLDTHLPPSLAYHNVFVLDLACVLGATACGVIETLKARGAVESMIHVVALFMSSEVIAMVQGKFPRVHIITAMIHSRRSYKHANEINLETVLERFEQVYSVQAANI